MKKLLQTSAWLAIVVGVLLVIGGIWAITFTYQNVVKENIVTPDDASIPGVPVRGPFTLKAQADIIRTHVLRSSGGLTYAEMPRQIPKVDEEGNPLLDENRNPIMVANTARDLWITATTLITALNLGIISYAFSAFVTLFGLITIWAGSVFNALSRRY